MTSEPRHRLEGAEETVRGLLSDVPSGPLTVSDREELDRLMLVLERMARKAAALARALEEARAAARFPGPESIH